MKKIITLSILFLLGFSIKAQITGTLTCNCPKPIEGKFVQIEMMVENQDMGYKKKLLDMACADTKKDSPETIKAKVNCMWEKYYKEFGCNSTGFLVANGNILKYAVNNEFEHFVDGMVKFFGININLKDPADGKTLLDFTLDEINRYKKNKDYQYKVSQLQTIYDHFKKDLKAKHASEL